MISPKTALSLLAAIFTCEFAAVSAASAQTASFSFNDQNGPADAGSYPAGAGIPLSINLTFAPGGTVTNLLGLSYWFEQQSPLGPFYFSITNRDATGSPFTSMQTPSPTYPQSLAPTTSQDLGGLTPSFTGLGAGTYFIANVKIAINPATPPGTYILENTTTAAGKRSVISDDHGHTFGISKTTYTLTVVPFKITSITPDDQGILLQCAGVPNSVNRIEASPDLSPNSFQTIGSVTPDASGGFSFRDSAPGTNQFYRLAFP